MPCVFCFFPKGTFFELFLLHFCPRTLFWNYSYTSLNVLNVEQSCTISPFGTLKKKLSQTTVAALVFSPFLEVNKMLTFVFVPRNCTNQRALQRNYSWMKNIERALRTSGKGTRKKTDSYLRGLVYAKPIDRNHCKVIDKVDAPNWKHKRFQANARNRAFPIGDVDFIKIYHCPLILWTCFLVFMRPDGNQLKNGDIDFPCT